MKAPLAFLFFLAFACSTYAQVSNSQVDLSKLSYAELDSLMHIEYDNGALEKAIPYVQAARAKAKVEFGEQDSIFAEYNAYLGFFYAQMGQYQQAEPLYLQTIAIDKKNLGEQHPIYALSLNNLAALYQNMGNYTKAEPLYLQAMEILKKALGEEDPEYALSLNNLAVLYESMGNYTQAEPLFLQATAIRKKVLGEQHPEYATSLNNLAYLYTNIGNHTQAEHLFLQAMAIWKKALGVWHPEYATSLHNLAGFYERIKNYVKAEPLYLQAIAIQKKVLGEQHPDYTQSLNNLAVLYKNMGKLDAAFYYCRWSFFANAPTMDSSFVDWGNLDTFSYVSTIAVNHSIGTLLSILQRQYDLTQDKSKLESYYTVSQAAIRLNERIRNEFTGEVDKLRILAENNGFVLAAIQSGLELGKKDYEAATFGFAEMNKGILLLEAAKTTNAQQFGDLPDTLAALEKNLQKTQSNLHAQLLENRPNIEKDNLRRVLNGINHEIDVFTKMLKNKYPKYAALKYDNKTASAKEIQALLDDKTALLEYIIGDSVVYVFYVDKKQVKLTPIYLSNKILNKKIEDFHHTLSNYDLAIKETGISYQKYTENAFWFYENLVAPSLKFATNINKLLIVSDGELGHLPFEAFLTKAAPQKQTNYQILSYLSNDYKISYNYSASLWSSAKESPKNKNNGQILGMASNYDINASATINTKLAWRLPYEKELRMPLMALPAAQKEIETLAEKFNGFFAFDNDASEKNFKAKAGDYAIIHLAMHGLLDNKNPILSSLAFTENGDSLENNFLQAYEISKMKLNADLVVLSACETGYGRFEKGNGIASLAQAFSYAGAPAMVVSLWQVNDYATSEIMKNLYQNLAAGMEKDEALQQAKIRYIKAAQGIAAHPAFWSPFVLMGNTDAIYLKTKGGWFWWGIGLAAFLGAILGWTQRKKR